MNSHLIAVIPFVFATFAAPSSLATVSATKAASTAKVGPLKCPKGENLMKATGIGKKDGFTFVDYTGKSGNGTLNLTEAEAKKRGIVQGGRFCLTSLGGNN